MRIMTPTTFLKLEQRSINVIAHYIFLFLVFPLTFEQIGSDAMKKKQEELSSLISKNL